MNVRSLKIKIAEIICDYAKHQLKNHEKDISSDRIKRALGTHIKDLQNLETKDDVKRLKKIIDAINTVYNDPTTSRKEHLDLFYSMILKLIETQQYIFDGSISERKRREHYDNVHDDMTMFIEIYEKMLTSTEEGQMKLTFKNPFADEPSETKRFSLNALNKPSMNPLIAFTSRQLAINISHHFNTLKTSCESTADTLKEAFLTTRLQEKENASQQLRARIEELEAELARSEAAADLTPDYSGSHSQTSESEDAGTVTAEITNDERSSLKHHKSLDHLQDDYRKLQDALATSEAAVKHLKGKLTQSETDRLRMVQKGLDTFFENFEPTAEQIAHFLKQHPEITNAYLDTHPEALATNLSGVSKPRPSFGMPFFLGNVGGVVTSPARTSSIFSARTDGTNGGENGENADCDTSNTP